MALIPDLITYYLDEYLPKEYIDEIRNIDEYKNVRMNYKYIPIDLDTIKDIYDLDNIIVGNIIINNNHDIFINNLNFFKYIQSLAINNLNINIDTLPPNIKSLYICHDNFNKKIDNLPDSLTILYITSNIFNKQIDKLPSNLLHLHVSCDEFYYSVDFLPDNLMYFSI